VLKGDVKKVMLENVSALHASKSSTNLQQSSNKPSNILTFAYLTSPSNTTKGGVKMLAMQ